MARPGYDAMATESPVQERSELPYNDALTAWLVDGAIDVLSTVRSPLGPADPAVRLSCLASVQAEAEGRTEEAVALAFEAGYGWDEIAMRMAVFPVEEVAERFGPYIAWRAAGRSTPVPPAGPSADLGRSGHVTSTP
jgi:hypothetical protein